MSLTLEDTNPEYREGNVHPSVTDAISKSNLEPAIAVNLKTSVSTVISRMKTEKKGCALIVEGNEVVGIFTERDILKRITRPEMDLEEIEIQHMMTVSPEVLNDHDPISLAIHKMATGNFRHVPVQMKDGQFRIFGFKDALNYLI